MAGGARERAKASANSDVMDADSIRIPVIVHPVITIEALMDDVLLAEIADHVKEKAWAEFMEQIKRARTLKAARDAAAQKETN